MDARPQQVEIYQTSGGSSPFKKWFRAVRDQRAKQKIRARIARLRLGNFGDCQTVGEGILELRIHYGPGYRVYLGRDGDHLVILLVGGDKRTQTQDISSARSLWQEYQETKDAGQ